MIERGIMNSLQLYRSKCEKRTDYNWEFSVLTHEITNNVNLNLTVKIYHDLFLMFTILNVKHP